MQELHKNTEDIYAPDQEMAARIRQIKRTMLRQLGNWIKPPTARTTNWIDLYWFYTVMKMK